MEEIPAPLIDVRHAVLPAELMLGSPGASCPGDGCNSDQGGCTGDASCGQDC